MEPMREPALIIKSFLAMSHEVDDVKKCGGIPGLFSSYRFPSEITHALKWNIAERVANGNVSDDGHIPAADHDNGPQAGHVRRG